MAAFIPLIASITPSLIELIAGLIHKTAPKIEQDMGPNTGPVKFAMLIETVMAALTSAAEAGTIDKNLPSVDVVKLIAQSIVSSLNMQGMLDERVSVPSATGASTVGTTIPGVGKVIAILVQQ